MKSLNGVLMIYGPSGSTLENVRALTTLPTSPVSILPNLGRIMSTDIYVKITSVNHKQQEHW